MVASRTPRHPARGLRQGATSDETARP